jgi:hypothetical protein
MTDRTQSVEACHRWAISATVCPWPDIIATAARRSRTGSVDRRVIRCSFCPSLFVSDRTNTSAGRAMAHLHPE